MKVLLLSSLCVVLLGLVGAKDEPKKKVVTTLLNAKWSSAPFVLEAAEFLAQESNFYFWEMMEFLAEEEANLSHMTDKELYDKVISFSSRYLAGSQLSLLKLSLSLRAQSPRLEMFQQIAKDRLIDKKFEKCKTSVIEYGGKLYCSAEDVKLVAGKSEDDPQVFKVDHVYPHVDEAANTLFLYAQPGTPGFGSLHNKLKSMASTGQVKYVLRPFIHKYSAAKTRLSGYGVELQIKSTEYKAQDDRKVDTGDQGDAAEGDEEDKEDEVGGFIFNKLNEQHPNDKEKLAEFRQHLLDQNNDMAPMKVWQIQDLSLQAAERIMSSPKEKQLKILTDLAQNFPSQARSLSKTSVSKDLKKEVKKNQDTFMMNTNIQPSDAALFINGLFFDMEYEDIFNILETLKAEGKVLDGLGELGMNDQQAMKLISQDFSSGKQTYGVDVRDSAVNWINNIEKDAIYKNWPEGVQELLRPTFPGMLRSIKKNFFNLVIICDPSKKESRGLLKTLESFYVHRAPTRIGIVFLVNDDTSVTGNTDVGVALMNAFNYIATNKAGYDGLAFITDVFAQIDETEEVTVDLVKKQFLEGYGADVKLEEVFGEDSEYDVGRQLARDFARRSGFNTFPQAMMNGVPLEEKYVSTENFEEGIMMALMKATNELQMAVYKGRLKDKDDVLDFLMDQPNIMPRLNDRILKGSSNFLDFKGDSLPSLKLDTFENLGKDSKTSTLAEHMRYLTAKEDSNRLHVLTVWVVADLETTTGREILRGALAHIKGSSAMRVAVIDNSKKTGLLSKIVKLATEKLDSSAIRQLLPKVAKEETIARLESGKKNLKDYDIPGADMGALAKAVENADDKLFAIDSLFCQEVLNLKKGQNMIIANGRVIGPFDEDEVFGEDDFNLLEKFSMSQYGDKMMGNYYSFLNLKTPKVSDQAMKTIALLLTRTATKSRKEIPFYGDKHSVIKLDPKVPNKPAFDITAIIDPVGLGAQKVAALLLVLSDVVNAKIRVFLNCAEKLSELPHKSYYRLVLDPELSFSNEGRISSGPLAKFANLPEEPIFTMHYHIPDNWLVEPVKSIYDMDNIKLSAADGSIHSEYELEYLLLEGHCFEAFSGNPPRGLQLTLGTKTEPIKGDTIVMANLGYLQLKSNPGRWILNLREGRSADLYDIVSHENTEEGDQPIQVMIDSFQSKIIKLKVQKKPDKRNEELLEADDGDGGDESGLWSSLKSTFGSDEKKVVEKDEDETLNIFCLASGHLYERLLKIMMLSTIRHTKAPVKFWILKSYLSPAIKEFLPEYAKRYGFEYEYVQYKWPRWLNQQKEKQRIIWGYKILFLDVMFPLDVKKIIFVDTDQIVRADLTELRDMDLKGAPYGYTPFCDSNKDMEGFRFWKTGYWKNHLAGRPYHISALYVVDLVKFRRIAAGDRLRGQYQALSQDPNSLSNLDQDLPNNMIHQVPIFSLPQEWLYCETWCHKSELAKAKSIDLCNNPLTKESKLDAARRIVSEWTDYDEEMHRFAEEIKSGNPAASKQQGGEKEQQHQHSEL